MTVKQLLDTMDSDEISEQMAYDALRNDSEFRKRLEADRDAERWAEMTPEEQGAEQRRILLGG